MDQQGGQSGGILELLIGAYKGMHLMGKVINPSGFLWVALGIFLCIGSLSLRLGDFQRPGPGFMPFLSGLAMLILGSISIFIKAPQELVNTEEIAGERALSRKKIRSFWVPLSLLFAYIMLLEPLGFLLATFLFLFSLFKLKDKRWLAPLIFSAVVVLVSYLFFSVWLKAQFPKGIFKIGG